MSATSSKSKPAYPIGSVDSALRLLLMVGDRRHMRIAEASEELGVARSTAHRLLQMLSYHGFVEQDPESKMYSAGPALIGLGLQVVRDFDVRAIARPYIEALVSEVQETVHLLQLRQDGELTCLESIESPRALRVGGRTGMTLPAFASAAGRSLLATMTREQIEALFPTSKLPARLPATITKRSELLKLVGDAREQGYAVQRDETEAGVSAVAAAIVDARGRAGHAITVALPSTRMRDEDVPLLGAAVTRCAEQIAHELP